MYGLDEVILLIYGSHGVRHADFRRLTVVNGPPRNGVSHSQSHSSTFFTPAIPDEGRPLVHNLHLKGGPMTG